MRRAGRWPAATGIGGSFTAGLAHEHRLLQRAPHRATSSSLVARTQTECVNNDPGRDGRGAPMILCLLRPAATTVHLRWECRPAGWCGHGLRSRAQRLRTVRGPAKDDAYSRTPAMQAGQHDNVKPSAPQKRVLVSGADHGKPPNWPAGIRWCRWAGEASWHQRRYTDVTGSRAEANQFGAGGPDVLWCRAAPRSFGCCRIIANINRRAPACRCRRPILSMFICAANTSFGVGGQRAARFFGRELLRRRSTARDEDLPSDFGSRCA